MQVLLIHCFLSFGAMYHPLHIIYCQRRLDDRVGVVYKKGLCMVISMGIGNDDMLSGFGYLGYALLNMHSVSEREVDHTVMNIQNGIVDTVCL